MKKVNTKPSAKKKLIPAAGSLLISAAMLSTSTYAWFTMSREVEVRNIKMTATVPEDLQISLGHLKDFTADTLGEATVETAPGFTGLSGNQGILVPASTASGATADDGGVKAPNTGTDAVSMLDWASSADVSEYYRLGKIIPASSIDGQNIYFTPDAAGVGKSLKSGAKYYQAANLTTAFTWKTDANNAADSTYVATGGDANGDSAKTTLHAINNVTEANDKWNDGVTTPSTATNETDNKYETATEWNVTNDDGYYVDIPIWIRSSAKSELTLAVDAYVTTKQAKDDDDLYLAARAAILYTDTKDGDDGYGGEQTKSSNLLRIRKDTLEADPTTASIVNYMYTTNATGDAVNSTAGEYADAKEYMGYQFLKVAAGANNTYGPMTKAIVRVWLEGEDPNCWNSNAGQDFNISLMFTKTDMFGADGDTLPTGFTSDAGTATYPKSQIDHTGNTYGTYNKTGEGTSSLLPGARVWVKSETTIGSNTYTDLLQFEYNGTKWSQVTDGSFTKYEGFTYTYNSATITTSDDIATQLKSTITTLALVEAHDTTTEAIGITVAAAQNNGD